MLRDRISSGETKKKIYRNTKCRLALNKDQGLTINFYESDSYVHVCVYIYIFYLLIYVTPLQYIYPLSFCIFIILEVCLKKVHTFYQNKDIIFLYLLNKRGDYLQLDGRKKKRLSVAINA